MIIDHNNLRYLKQWQYAGKNRFNGAYYYSREIVKNIIPNVKTDRSWVTINVSAPRVNHAIVFVHDNLKPEKTMSWLANSKDLVLVCGVKATMEKVKRYGIPIYLPLSVDIPYIAQFKTEKTRDVAYVGRKGKPGTENIPEGVDFISGLRREELLKELAKYKKVYAVGRCAIEARVLGCEILPFDERYPDPSVWKILDNRFVAKMLQLELDKIDKRRYDD